MCYTIIVPREIGKQVHLPPRYALSLGENKKNLKNLLTNFKKGAIMIM